MYDKEKKYASEAGISSVGSSMIWGSQWDAILNWILKGSNASKVDSPSTKHATTTGSTEVDVMNKIYDLGNNLWEWTLEAYFNQYRVSRGGNHNYDDPPSHRYYSTGPYATYETYGSRLTLYIK